MVELYTKVEKEKELIFVENTAVFTRIKKKKKDLLILWKSQLLNMLPVLTCFSADFGIKLILLYLIKEYPEVARKAVKKTSLTMCRDLSVGITVITLKSSCKENTKIN